MALCSSRPRGTISFFFFFNDTATTEIYTLSLHDALPILGVEDVRLVAGLEHRGERGGDLARVLEDARSEEHTSELQSPCNLVCRLLLEKKKKTTIFMRPHLGTSGPYESSARDRHDLRTLR